MAVEIDRARQDVQTPPGFTVETARDQSDLEDWVSVWLFPVPEPVRRRHLVALLQRGLADGLPWRFYLGRLDGKPVATSESFLGAGAAAMDHVVTVPDQRRPGLGTATTLQVLRDARRQGYQVAVLSASDEGDSGKWSNG